MQISLSNRSACRTVRFLLWIYLRDYKIPRLVHARGVAPCYQPLSSHMAAQSFDQLLVRLFTLTDHRVLPNYFRLITPFNALSLEQKLPYQAEIGDDNPSDSSAGRTPSRRKSRPPSLKLDIDFVTRVNQVLQALPASPASPRLPGKSHTARSPACRLYRNKKPSPICITVI
jgi:hypothetical protein